MHIEGTKPPTKGPFMSLSAYSVQGNRLHMEDYYDIGYQLKPIDQRHPKEWPYEYFYFGIFDGHGGKEAAKFAKKNLLKLIVNQKDFWSNDDEDVKRAIRSGFAETHKAMRKELPKWSRTRVLPSTAGTTASVLFIRNGKFYTGHVGDSRIVISKENEESKHWIAQQLTEDHKPESKEETERIQRAGGEVKNKFGVHRVVWKRPVIKYEAEKELIRGRTSGVHNEYMDMVSTYPIEHSLVDFYQTLPLLAIARSLGDFWSLNPYTGQYTVSPEPDITCRPIEKNDKCILLATDGLWNVMNSSQAIRILQELYIIKSGQRQYYDKEYFTIDNFYDIAGDSSENHAQSLVYLTYQIWKRRCLRSDNITVVVAVLHDILEYFHHSNKTHTTRANSSLSVRNINQNLETKIIQLKETKSFMEKIRQDEKPKFIIPESRIFNDLWYKMEDLLNFPPTVFELDDDLQHLGLVPPKNYARLSVAECRRIPRFDDRRDSYIYIKRVSDDPADEYEQPTRKNKSGKEVRDASAQATQGIYDFGQPWDQLLDDSVEEDINCPSPLTDEEWRRQMALFDHGDDEDDVDDEDEDVDVQDFVSCNQALDSPPCTKNKDDINELLTEQLEIECSVNDAQEDKKSIPQLRCLLNCTPPLRRSTRNSHQSLSDNIKRKVQVNTSSSLPESKRRKSQPVRLNLSRI